MEGYFLSSKSRWRGKERKKKPKEQDDEVAWLQRDHDKGMISGGGGGLEG